LLSAFQFARECNVTTNSSGLERLSYGNSFLDPDCGQTRILQSREAILFVEFSFPMSDEH
jgi:hypothetical protein